MSPDLPQPVKPGTRRSLRMVNMWPMFLRKPDDKESGLDRSLRPARSRFFRPPTARFRGLSFSRDGNFIYFVAADLDNKKGALFQIPVLGGPPRKLIEDIQSPNHPFSRWQATGLFAGAHTKENALMVANLDGSEARQLAKHSAPGFLLNHGDGLVT